MTLELANRSVTLPEGIAQDVIVRVDKFNFLADFVVVDFEVDPRVPIILERHFLRTAKALVDFSPLIETSDSSLEEFADELALLEPFPPGNEDDNFDPEADLREIEYLLNRDSSTDSSLKTDIDIIDPILERFTDEPAFVYSVLPEDDDDDLFEFKSDNEEWKKLFDSTLPKESSEIATLLSSPFENKDKVFNPCILILRGTQIFHDESKDKDLKVISSTEALLILLQNNFQSHSSDRSSDRKLLFFLESTMIETLLSFLSKNKDKVFSPSSLISNRVHYINLDLSHRNGTFICI
nr:reverse transcriptase domain-containing protein [Tanacetum cinerariifolium]